VTSLLRDSHWLPVKQRVDRCLYGDASSYLVDLITPSAAANAESMNIAGPRTLSSFGDRPFATTGRARGTSYRHTSV